MKLVELIHNPEAGGQDDQKKELVALLSQNGYDCRYLSTKSTDWKNFNLQADVVAIAGGDGTVRQVVKKILNRRLWKKPEQLAIFPMGTANNISKCLNIEPDLKTNINSWKDSRRFSFDVGIIDKIPGNKFFLEGFGFGIFPALMQKMNMLKNIDSPDESLSVAREQLHELILSYPSFYCHLEIDGKEYSGNFIMVEIMNIPSIGPNLTISTSSHPGDGKLEIILITDSDRKKLADYVESLKSGKQKKYMFKSLTGKKIRVRCKSSDAHADDQIVKIKEDKSIGIYLKKGLLDFLVPK